MSKIILPKKDEDGNYYISYSQWSSWKAASSFNLGIPGKQEYILSYFFGMDWPDAGWAQFGQDVEDYICTKAGAEKFTDAEKNTLDKITPLGVFQEEIKLWIFDNVYVKGFIDDRMHDWSLIQDYKTASNNSRQRYYKDDYYQLDLYAAAGKEVSGILPEARVCIIERKGNAFGKVNARNILSVGNEIWYHKREISETRINKVLAHLRTTVIEISDAYQLYLKLKDLAL